MCVYQNLMQVLCRSKLHIIVESVLRVILMSEFTLDLFYSIVTTTIPK